MKRLPKYLCLSVFICGFISAVFADSTPVLTRTGKTFDPAIPTIRSVLGYDFGEQITRHSAMEQYIQALAKALRRNSHETTAKISAKNLLRFCIRACN